MEEILDPLIHRLGLVHHGHGFALQSRVSHAVVNVLVLLEHPQLHLCLYAHRLQRYQRNICARIVRPGIINRNAAGLVVILK